jgi:hypothetical protein
LRDLDLVVTFANDAGEKTKGSKGSRHGR